MRLQLALLLLTSSEVVAFSPQPFLPRLVVHGQTSQLAAGVDPYTDIVKNYQRKAQITDIDASLPPPLPKDPVATVPPVASVPPKVVEAPPPPLPESPVVAAPDVASSALPKVEIPPSPVIEGKSKTLFEALQSTASENIPTPSSSSLSMPELEVPASIQDVIKKVSSPPSSTDTSPLLDAVKSTQDFVEKIKPTMKFDGLNKPLLELSQKLKETAPPSESSTGQAKPLLNFLTENVGKSIEEVRASQDMALEAGLVAPPYSSQEALPNAAEKLQILKENLIGTDTIEGAKKAATVASGALGAAVSGGSDLLDNVKSGNLELAVPDVDVKGLSSASFAGLQQLISSSSLGWFVAAAALLFASNQKNESEKAKLKYEAELAKANERATQAAELAVLAAESAKEAKEMAMRMDKGKEDSSASDYLLKQAQLDQAQVDMSMMKKQMEKMAKEATLLRIELEQATGAKEKSPTPTSVAEEVVPATKVELVIETDPESDERIVDYLKELDDENSKKQKVKPKPKPVPEPEPEPEPEPVLKEKAKPAKKAPKKKVAKKAKGKPVPEPEPEIKEEVVMKEAKPAKKKKASKKKAKKEVKTVEIPQPEPVAASESGRVDNPWAELSDSALLRKTSAALSEYLNERNVPTTNEKGKLLLKKMLVQAVKSL